MTVKRQGNSTALVMPIRRPTEIGTLRQAGGRDEITIGPAINDDPLSPKPIPKACVSFPGPEHRSRTRLGSIPRRTAIASIPEIGSSARIRVPAPIPSGSLTALSIA